MRPTSHASRVVWSRCPSDGGPRRGSPGSRRRARFPIGVQLEPRFCASKPYDGVVALGSRHAVAPDQLCRVLVAESQACSFEKVVNPVTQVSEQPADTSTGAKQIRGRDEKRKALQVKDILVSKIRAEDGLGRKRDRNGHRELRRSIEQFGVLTPITVRRTSDASGEYLLIKGQGRTLACEMLGIQTIPAIVVGEDFAEDEKVQQFLVENVARLRMRPVDRALLISRARQQGEETADVARRFGVSPVTVRRLQGQLNGASKREVAALKSGNMNLALHAVISRHVDSSERADIVAEISKYALRAREIDELFRALGWQKLADLGNEHRAGRLILLAWACQELSGIGKGSVGDRLSQLAERLPSSFALEPQRPQVVTVG